MSDMPQDKLAIMEMQGRSQTKDALDDEEKILAGQYDVDYPAMLTRDSQGG
jgi:hypothetical protein